MHTLTHTHTHTSDFRRIPPSCVLGPFCPLPSCPFSNFAFIIATVHQGPFEDSVPSRCPLQAGIHRAPFVKVEATLGRQWLQEKPAEDKSASFQLFSKCDKGKKFQQNQPSQSIFKHSSLKATCSESQLINIWEWFYFREISNEKSNNKTELNVHMDNPGQPRKMHLSSLSNIGSWQKFSHSALWGWCGLLAATSAMPMLDSGFWELNWLQVD